MDSRHRKPWWKKKRWRLAVAAWLLLPIAYLLSSGPAAYVCRGGWLGVEVYNAVWGRPLDAFFPMPLKQATGWQRYYEGWVRLAREHFPQ